MAYGIKVISKYNLDKAFLSCVALHKTSRFSTGVLKHEQRFFIKAERTSAISYRPTPFTRSKIIFSLFHN